jgi:hypothetical protein
MEIAMADHFAQLSKDVQKALRRAESKVLWELKPAHLKCGAHLIDAYPVRRSGGLVTWTVTSQEHGLVIACGTFSRKDEA